MGTSHSKKRADDEIVKSKTSRLCSLPPYSTIAGNRQGVITRIKEETNTEDQTAFTGATNGTPYIYYSTLKSAKKKDLDSLYVVKTDSRHKEYQKKLLYIREGQHLENLD